LGFFQLSKSKSQQIQTNRWLPKLALPKPNHLDVEARFEVLPAVFPLTAEPLFALAHFVWSIYRRLPPTDRIVFPVHTRERHARI
jgi:hypothetical protein